MINRWLALTPLVLLSLTVAATRPAPPARKTEKSVPLPTFADLSGKQHSLTTNHSSLPTVYVFLATDCPVASRTAPQVARLAKRYAKRGVRFFAVYPNELETTNGVRRHARERGMLTALPVVQDRSGNVARALGAGFTPEAVLVGKDGVVMYRGNVESLIPAIDASVAGKSVTVAKTGVAGCALRLRSLSPPTPNSGGAGGLAGGGLPSGKTSRLGISPDTPASTPAPQDWTKVVCRGRGGPPHTSASPRSSPNTVSPATAPAKSARCRSTRSRRPRRGRRRWWITPSDARCHPGKPTPTASS
jgi:thiol-disulfide isomerase/thioredoxin